MTKESTRPIEVILVGDGVERARLEQKARLIQFSREYLNILFLGWRGREEMEALLESQHALIFSSLWPEPFGLIGAKAVNQGLPVVAFDTGGVSEWLKNGDHGRDGGPHRRNRR